MTPQLFHIRDYKGATIEDLDIRPAISVNPSTTLKKAFQVSFEHEFSYLPVIHETNKRLLGVLNLQKLNHAEVLKNGDAEFAKDHMLWFSNKAKERYELGKPALATTTPLNSKIFKPRPAGKGYFVLTPMSPLEDLSSFFNSGNYFAIITNGEGNLVYGVVTPEDLTKYEHSRPRL